MIGIRNRRRPSFEQRTPLPLFETLESRQLLSAASGITLHDDLQILKNSTSSSNIQGYTPSQIEQAYGINDVTFNDGAVKGDGAGQTIAIVDAFNAPDIVSDLGVFDAQFGIAHRRVSRLSIKAADRACPPTTRVGPGRSHSMWSGLTPLHRTRTSCWSRRVAPPWPICCPRSIRRGMPREYPWCR